MPNRAKQIPGTKGTLIAGTLTTESWGLRAVCDKHGILLIVDEVQSGFGRTSGRGEKDGYFAIQESGVRPDILVIAKVSSYCNCMGFYYS